MAGEFESLFQGIAQQQGVSEIANVAGISLAVAGIIIGVLMIWELVWKGVGMWKAAQNGSKVWFVVLLLVNTLGILPILYIFLFSKWEKKLKNKKEETKKSPKRKSKRGK